MKSGSLLPLLALTALTTASQYFTARPHLAPGGEGAPPVPAAPPAPALAPRPAAVPPAPAPRAPPPPPAPRAPAPPPAPPAAPRPVSPPQADESTDPRSGGSVRDFARGFRSSTGEPRAPAQPRPLPAARTGPSGPSALPAGLKSSKNFFGGFQSQASRDAERNRSGVLAGTQARYKPPASSVPPPPTRATGTLPSAANPPASQPIPQPPPPAPPVPQEEDEEEGELVEAMYDYNGPDADDLSFRERQIIRVVEHVNEDWAKGSLDGGPVGMFPKAYTKPI